jgi:hypothetical protein
MKKFLIGEGKWINQKPWMVARDLTMMLEIHPMIDADSQLGIIAFAGPVAQFGRAVDS